MRLNNLGGIESRGKSLSFLFVVYHSGGGMRDGKSKVFGLLFGVYFIVAKESQLTLFLRAVKGYT